MVTTVAISQIKTITGVVNEESGMPLPGVSVIIKGTTEGTQTDFDGKFQIKTEVGQTLVFSFIGLKTQEVVVSTSPMKIVLVENENTLDEVVVTALGIKRERKALGYSQQEVKGDKLNSSGQTNALSSLSGNVAGVQVTAPSTMGGSNRITIRGISSVTQNNRPLIVVDGIPFDNSNYNSSNTQTGSGGRDYGDAIADINPEDIESVNVLKGAAAAALYGSRAQNGVIMYTTKKGKNGKSEISVKSGIVMESIYLMPELQRQYGGGGGTSLPTAIINGQVYNVADYQLDESWGPKYDSNLMHLPWDAFDAHIPEKYMVEKPWVAPKNDVDKFFNTGITSNTNLSLSHSNDKSSVRFSYGNQSTEGVVPNSQLKRNTMSFNGSANISKKLKIEGGFTYTSNKGENRPIVGYNNSLASQLFQWGQRNVDYGDLRNYVNPDGTQRAWNRTAWNDADPKYMDNPYWMAYRNTSSDSRDRYYGNVKLQYNFTDDLFIVGNVYGDNYQFNIKERVAMGSVPISSYSISQNNSSEFNYEARLHYNKNFNNFTLNTFVGANRRKSNSSNLSANTDGGLVIPNLYNVSNSVNPSRGFNSESRLTINSIFAMTSLGFYDMLYLEGTVRKDYFSTVVEAGVYPAVTGSFIFSQLMKDSNWLSFGKVRASWAKVSNGASPYSLQNYYSVGTPFNGIPTYGQSNTTNNPELVPESKTSKEIGLETKFFNNRFGIDVAVYEDVTEDLITPLQITGGTGFQYKYFNAGKMRNRGIEATVYLNPIRTENFAWEIDWNFAKNDNKLLELNGNSETLTIGSGPFNASVIAKVGERYGQIYGFDFQYDANGNRMTRNGQYLRSATQTTLGSVIPDYNMGLRNTFTYKGVRLSALIDMQKGGNYFSTNHMWGMYTGMLEATAANGIRENGIVLPGVDSVTGQPNTTSITATAYGRSHYSGPTALNVFDASYVKLREVTLGYSFPGKLFNNKVSSVNLTAFGRNLFAWGLDWKNMDPETASTGSGNMQGIEGGVLPSTRTYGMSLEIKI
jgi:TonB-linked SusC/RagA family outer membrane protein